MDSITEFLESAGIDNTLLVQAADYAVAAEHQFYVDWLKNFESICWIKKIVNQWFYKIVIISKFFNIAHKATFYKFYYSYWYSLVITFSHIFKSIGFTHSVGVYYNSNS